MQAIKLSRCIVIIAAITLTSGCASNQGDVNRGSLMRLEYARVSDVRRVEMPSATPAGAIVGGFTGLMLSRDRSGSRQLATGIGGAALGAIAVSALEDRRGYEYTLRHNNNATSRFITDKGYLRRGDCVSIERGQYDNIRRVGDSYCTGSAAQQPPPEHLAMARQCLEAKNQLLAASDDEAIEQAARKVRILCQNLD